MIKQGSLLATSLVAAFITTSWQATSSTAAVVAVANFNASSLAVTNINNALATTPTITSEFAANYFVGTTTGHYSNDVAGNSYAPQGVSGGAVGAINTLSGGQNGKSLTFNFDLTGFQGPVMTYAVNRSNAGFTTNQWAYSVGGGAFIDFGGPFTVGTTYAVNTVDFHSIAALSNASNVKFRLTLTGASDGSANSRLDNFVFDANQLPKVTLSSSGATVDVSPEGLESLAPITISATDDGSVQQLALAGALPAQIADNLTITGGTTGPLTLSGSGFTYSDLGNYTLAFTATDNLGATRTANFTLSIVPEPTSLAAVGAAVALFRRRR